MIKTWCFALLQFAQNERLHHMVWFIIQTAFTYFGSNIAPFSYSLCDRRCQLRMIYDKQSNRPGRFVQAQLSTYAMFQGPFLLTEGILY